MGSRGQTWIYDKELDKCVLIEEYWARRQQAAKANYYVQDDTMGALYNPADGRTYDSKSAFIRATKNAGCEIIGDAYKGKTLEQLGPKERPMSDPTPMISAWLDGESMPEIPNMERFRRN